MSKIKRFLVENGGCMMSGFALGWAFSLSSPWFWIGSLAFVFWNVVNNLTIRNEVVTECQEAVNNTFDDMRNEVLNRSGGARFE
jgi:hypothetical protein